MAPRIPSLSKEVPGFYNRSYQNNHYGTFTDVTEKAGLRDRLQHRRCCTDFDHDGGTDLYVTGINHNILYRNNHDGTFTDVTEKAGVSCVNSAGKRSALSGRIGLCRPLREAYKQRVVTAV
jgi:hypothetical protein